MPRITVYHDVYGCDTGCCGHTVSINDSVALPVPSRGGVSYNEVFEFSHPYGDDHRAYAEQMIRDTFGDEHVADLDWDNCRIDDDG